MHKTFFGTNVGSLKGKTPRKKPEPIVMNNEYLPGGLLERHGRTTL